MTDQNDVVNDSNYRPVLDHGFIGIAYEEIGEQLVPAVLGNDKSIARSARMSYGKGTRTINDDESLIRYLLRHHHTTPFEMVEVKFHVKMPIFVARQWIRHRTASINEYSGRYSVMSNEFYVPAFEDIMPQSRDNKQGRDGEMSDSNKETVIDVFEATYNHAERGYRALLGDCDNAVVNYSGKFVDKFDEEYYEADGIARELARCVLPVGNYTELYWKANLHNIFHFMKLRIDSHAQKEIRVYAEAMYELLKPYVPIALQAFDDYIRNSTNLSSVELKLAKEFFNKTKWITFFPSEAREEEERLRLGMSKREWVEFKDKFDL